MTPMRTRFSILAFTITVVMLLAACKKDNLPDPSDGPQPGLWANQGTDLLKKGKARGNFKWDEIYQAFKQASDDYLTADIHDESTASAHHNAGYAAQQLERIDEALTFYQRALNENPALKESLLNLAYLHVQRSEAALAIPFYEAYLDKKNDDREIRAQLALTYAEAERFDEGVALVREMLFDDPEDKLAYKALAGIYFRQGNYKLSQVASANALKIDEKDADLHNNIGITHLKTGNMTAAIKSFKEALKIDPNNIEAGMNLGWIALGAGDNNLAGQTFQGIINAEPGNIDARLGYAIALRGAEAYDDAMAEYDKILKVDKCHAKALFNKAMIQIRFQIVTVQDAPFGDIKATTKTLEAYKTCHGNDETSGKIQSAIDEVQGAIDKYVAQIEEMIRIEAEMARQLEEAKKRGDESFKKGLALRNKYYWCAELYAGDPSWIMYFDETLMGLEFAMEEDYADFINQAVDGLEEFLIGEYGYLTYALELGTFLWNGEGEQKPALGCESPGLSPDGVPLEPGTQVETPVEKKENPDALEEGAPPGTEENEGAQAPDSGGEGAPMEAPTDEGATSEPNPDAEAAPTEEAPAEPQ